MRFAALVKTVKGQIRRQEFGTVQRIDHMVNILTVPDPGFRRAAHAPPCLR